jgi:hypothetical protein
MACWSVAEQGPRAPRGKIMRPAWWVPAATGRRIPVCSAPAPRGPQACRCVRARPAHQMRSQAARLLYGSTRKRSFLMPISLSVPGSPSCHAGRISPLSHSRSDVRTQSPSDLSLFSWIPIDRSPSLFFPVVFYLRWQESWRVDRGCGQRMDGRDRRRGRLCCGARAGGACSCTQACRWWSRVLDGMCRERRELRCHVPSGSWRGVLVSRDGNGG